MKSSRGCCLTTLGLLFCASRVTAQATATDGNTQVAPVASPAAWREDLRFFMESVTRTHPAFFRKHQRVQNFATIMQNQTRATFIGEPTGSAPNHYGDPRRIRLPTTNVSVFISTRVWQDAAITDTRDALAPTIHAEPTFAEWLRGLDPALQAALR